MGKRGPKPASVEELRRRGSKLIDAEGKRRGTASRASGRPAIWDRPLIPDGAILTARKAQSELTRVCGYDPFADAGDSTFDARAAKAAVRWFHRHMTHVKGPLGGQGFRLSPFEQGIVGAIFGWRRPDGTRRFRTVLVYVPRKFGKTILACGLCLYPYLEDDEEGAEAYVAAASRDQASLLWTTARRQIMNDEYLTDRCRLYQHSIARRRAGVEDGSWFKAISAEAHTAHGFNPSVYVVDELHAQPDGELVDVLDTGTAARSQPLAIYLTTADYERESICNEVYEYAGKVRDGLVRDAGFLPVVVEASSDDDWTSEETWAKANPHYPDTPTQDYMRKRCSRAKETPRFLNTFLRLNLNVRTQSDISWLDMGKWDACEGAVRFEDLIGRPCYGALDVSSVSDLTCFLLLFPEDGNRVLAFFWAPRETALRREEKHLLPSYLAWERAGAMELCDGGWIDQRRIRSKIVELGQTFKIQNLAVDRWNTSKIITELREDDGFTVTDFGQGFGSMSAPSKALERAVLAGDLQHGGHPVLRWCAGNAMVEVSRTPTEDIKPVKAKTKGKARRQDDNKIDGVVCLVMAMGLAMVDGALGRPSLDEVYADELEEDDEPLAY